MRKEQAVNSEGIAQYTRWFELMKMDFSLHYSSGGWLCIAHFRQGGADEYVTDVLPSVSEAMQSIYTLIMKDVRSL
jgi:hypothetical protein